MAPRGLGSLFAMPRVGILTQYVDSRKLLGMGLALGAVTAYWLSILSLDIGFWDLFWPQLLQGIALGLLFVPLTVVAMSHISKEDMGNATSVFNMVRNIGASIGIAAVGAYLTRSRTANRARMAEQFDGYSEASRGLLDGYREIFLDRGLAEPDASREALIAVAAEVSRQADLVSYVSTFQFLAIIFLCMTPIVVLMRRPDL